MVKKYGYNLQLADFLVNSAESQLTTNFLLNLKLRGSPIAVKTLDYRSVYH